MKKVCLFMIVICLIGLGMVGKDASADKPLILKYNTNIKNENQKGSASIHVFKEELEKLTNGRVKVKFFYGLSLANTPESVLGGLQTKTFELGDFPTGGFSIYSTAFMPLDVPYLIPSSETAHEIMRGEIGRKMAEKFRKDTDIRILAYVDLGFRHITNSVKPIYSPSDLKGLKIRTQGNPLHIKGFKTLGASPTPLAFSELFTSLQQGVVDGQENPITNIFNFKFYEVQEYLSLTGHLYTAAAIIMGDEFYQGLPKDIQNAIDKASAAATEASIAELKENEANWLSEMKQSIKINELSPEQTEKFIALSKTSWDSMAKKIGATYFAKIKSMILDIQKTQ